MKSVHTLSAIEVQDAIEMWIKAKKPEIQVESISFENDDGEEVEFKVVIEEAGTLILSL